MGTTPQSWRCQPYILLPTFEMFSSAFCMNLSQSFQLWLHKYLYLQNSVVLASWRTPTSPCWSSSVPLTGCCKRRPRNWGRRWCWPTTWPSPTRQEIKRGPVARQVTHRASILLFNLEGKTTVAPTDRHRFRCELTLPPGAVWEEKLLLRQDSICSWSSGECGWDRLLR